MAGFNVERRPEFGGAWLVFGFGQAGLRKKLEGAARQLYRRLQWAGEQDGARALNAVLTEYENGAFLL